MHPVAGRRSQRGPEPPAPEPPAPEPPAPVHEEAGHLRHSRVCGLLLAAGEGSRLGQPKALLEVGGQSLAARAVSMLRDGGAEPIIVVTGAVAVSLPGVIAAHNPDWRSGMASSLRSGLATAPDACEAAVIALVDQPLIGAEVVRRLIRAYESGADIAVACYDGHPRNPVLIAREQWPHVVREARGDTGARPFLRAHPELVTKVECGDAGRPDDLDTDDDLRRVARLLDL